MTEKELWEIDMVRLAQCLLCANDPLTCGCDDTDEDENRMCTKYRKAERGKNGRDNLRNM